MELDDFKDRWAEYDRKLDTSIRLNTTLLRESGMGRARSALQRLSLAVIVALLINLVAAVILGTFMANHVREIQFLAPAALLHLCAVLLIISSIHQLVALRTIDYAAPIVAIQKKLALVRVLRIRTEKWTLILAPLLWTPLFIVTMKALFGVNPYEVPGLGWHAANLLLGLVFIVLVVWLSRRNAARLQRSPFVQKLMNDIAGRNLSAAVSFVAEISRFEEEEQPA